MDFHGAEIKHHRNHCHFGEHPRDMGNHGGSVGAFQSRLAIRYLLQGRVCHSKSRFLERDGGRFCGGMGDDVGVRGTYYSEY